MQNENESLGMNEQTSPKQTPDTNDKVFIRYGFLVIILVFGVFGIWMTYAPIDSASVASGKVVVEGNKKSIQHLEGGIVEAIYVKDGDSVIKGELLLKMDEIQAKAQLETVLSQYYEGLALECRLISERDDLKNIKFDAEIRNSGNDLNNKLIDGQTRLFHSRKKALASEKMIMIQKIEQLKKQIKGNRSIIKSKKSRLKSYREEILEWKVLYEEKLTDKLKLRELQRDAETIIGDIANSEAEIARLYVEISESKSKILLRKQEFTNEVGSELRDTQSSLSDMSARLNSLKDTLNRTKIIAPEAGIIVGMDTHTIGGVISPGQIILEIVPDISEMIIIAQVQITDIDKVKKGLKANVRFSAFNLQIAHVVEGEVIHISADSFVDEITGLPYYEAKVKLTEDGYKQLKENNFFLIHGMPAEVMIKTGERTVLSYLLKPIRRMFIKAFRED